MRAARKSEYASPIHCTSVAVAFSSLWMTGKATLTTEPSMKAMLDPRMVATRTHTPTRGALGAASGAERMTPSSQGAFTKVAICGSPSLYLYVTTFCVSSQVGKRLPAQRGDKAGEY